MDGIQETVYLGLTYLARQVASGIYGDGDEAFQSDVDSKVFLEDLQDQIIGKMV